MGHVFNHKDAWIPAFAGMTGTDETLQPQAGQV